MRALTCGVVGFAAMIFFLSGCSTEIRSYPVAAGTERQGGVPFFLPKPLIQVREPIEVGRSEALFAVLDIAGLEKFMYELKAESLDAAIDNLKRMLKTKRVDVKEKVSVPFYLKEELKKEKTETGANQSRETEESKKCEAAPASEIKSELKPLYKPSDAEKALTVLWVPDLTREYELLITPSAFASSDLSIKLTDGWRLDSISAKTGDNQLVKELADTLRAVVGAQKDIKVAEIAKEQALKLKEMETAAKPEAETKSFLTEGKELQIRVVGYVRKTVIKVIPPGLYELNFSDGVLSLPERTSEVWERVQL